jgi:uncharacterized protein
MTQEERQMLTDLANKIAQTPAPPRDSEADELIRTKIGSRPDALYIMTQTVLIQNMALEHAKQQIQDLQQRAAQGPQAVSPAASSSFLGAGQRQSQPGYAAAPPPPPPPSYAPSAPSAPSAPAAPGGGSSFLRSAATTAAGVAAGALAFEGIRSLFGGSGIGNLGGFGGGTHSGFLGDAPVSETIINNYYDSPEQSAREDASSYDDSDTQDSDTQDSDAQDSDDSAQSSDDTDFSDDSGDDSSGGDWV